MFAAILAGQTADHSHEERPQHEQTRQDAAPGVLLMGFMSTASAKFVNSTGLTAVSLGYDRIRFLRPVRIGDTIDVTYAVVRSDAERRRTIADATIHNSDGDLCVVAQHILTFSEH